MATKKAGAASPVSKDDIKQLVIKTLKVTIVGDTPLITHKWSEKAKRQMLDKQMKKTVEKVAKDPEADFESSIHRLPDGRPCFPSLGIKCAAVRAAKGLGIAMTDARAAFHVDGEYIPIQGDAPIAREDMVRLETGVPDIRYRAEFRKWSLEFTISYNAALLSPAQLATMINAAGFGTGLGEWRPEKSGRFGMFHLEGVEEVDFHLVDGDVARWDRYTAPEVPSSTEAESA